MHQNKIIFVTDGIYPKSVGGMQRHSRLLIETLAHEFDIHITVIHPHKNESLFSGYKNITEITCTEPTGSIYLKNCYEYSKIVYAALKKMPDQLIYAQGFSVWYKAHEFSNRLIVNLHGLEPWQAQTFKDKLIAVPFKQISKSIFRHAAKVVSLGGKLTGILKTLVPQNKIIVLPNAVKLPELKHRTFNNEPLQLLFVGRFAFNKGIDVLLEAAKQLNTEGFETHLNFNLVGKGPLFENLESSYKASNIIFHGFADDAMLNRLYADADLFVFPTLFEGMPTVVLEAMANALPIVVTDTGATAELVDNSNGYLIETKDVIALKNAIKQFFALRQEEKQKLSVASYNRVKSLFTWEAVAARHMDLFRSFWNNN